MFSCTTGLVLAYSLSYLQSVNRDKARKTWRKDMKEGLRIVKQEREEMNGFLVGNKEFNRN